MMKAIVLVVLAMVITQGFSQETIRGRTNTSSFTAPVIPAATVDVTAPEIELTEPTVVSTRGFKRVGSALDISTSNSTILVRGIARDTNGVARVLVNGDEALLRQVPGGISFESQVLLALGTNNIEINAVDKFRNEKSLSIVVTREQTGIQGEYHALVMAVQDYSDKSMVSLEHPIRDAQEFVDVLTKDYSFNKLNVTFLKNPDRRTILRAFGELQRTLKEDDNLLIFYAGHGYWDEAVRQGYWLPSNASAGDKSEWLSNSDIRDYIRGIKTRHTLLISDACFSGGIFKTRDPFIKPDISIQKAYEFPSRRAITSGSLKSVPDESVFLKYLIKRLSENDQKYIYAQKIYIEMKDAVINNSPSHQTPLYGVISETGDEGEGDFVFVHK
jgi:Caspase domain